MTSNEISMICILYCASGGDVSRTFTRGEIASLLCVTRLNLSRENTLKMLYARGLLVKRRRVGSPAVEYGISPRGIEFCTQDISKNV